MRTRERNAQRAEKVCARGDTNQGAIFEKPAARLGSTEFAEKENERERESESAK